MARNHESLDTGHSGMTCQNEPPLKKLSSASNCEEAKRRLSKETLKSGEELQSQQRRASNCEVKEATKINRRLSEETPKSGEELQSQQPKGAKNPTGNHKGLDIGQSGMTCQNESSEEKLSSASNCEAKGATKAKRRLSEETLKSGEELRSQQPQVTKNPMGNHKGLGTGHSGMTTLLSRLWRTRQRNPLPRVSRGHN